MTSKIFLADVASRDRELTKADISNAYTCGARNTAEPSYAFLPKGHEAYTEWGEPLIIELGTPLWGEPAAGRDWFKELERALIEMGLERSEGVPCMWHFRGVDSDVRLLTIVDDILISETRGHHEISDRILELLRSRFDITSQRDPTSFAGLKIARNRSMNALTLSLPQKVREALTQLDPQSELRDSSRASAPVTQGQMRALADALQSQPLADGAKLTPAQKRVQMAVGHFKYIERVMPAISLPVHRLASVMISAPPEATTVVNTILRYLSQHIDDGLTYGGGGLSSEPRLKGGLYADFELEKGAPRQLEGTADATYGSFELMGNMLTFCGAAVYHKVQRIAVECGSSHEAEALASFKLLDVLLTARNVLTAVGTPPQGPTFIATDNKAHMLVAHSAGSSVRSRHFLKKYTIMQERMERKEITIGHVKDAQNPADFLTKWVSADKFKTSLAYATNSLAYVP